MELFCTEQMHPIVQPLLRWYDACKREMAWRTEVSPYRTWVSEIMLQQTRVEAVHSYFARWMEALPTVEALAAAEEDELYKLWEGLGYYSRVRNLQKAARIVRDDFGGFLPADRQKLLSLPGIGEYTAGAILSIAFGQRAAAVDGNVIRVFARLLDIRQVISDDKSKKKLAQAIEEIMPDRTGDFTQSLMELGALICIPGAPRCEKCPLRQLCKGYAQGSAPTLPVLPPKPQKKVEQLTLCVLQNKTGAYFVRKRAAKGLLAGLWEPWHCEGYLTEEGVRTTLAEQGIKALKIRPLGHRHHIFTHKRWEMEGFWVCCEAAPDFTKVSPEQLKEEIALPVAFAPFFEQECKNEEK